MNWLEKNKYSVYGANGLEVPFSQKGLQALYILAKSLNIKDFDSIESLLRRNGIDLVAFSQEKGEVSLIELKGWTGTSSDFNETIHQILRRIESLHLQGFLINSIKFACAFPDFLPVPKWDEKYQNLKNIINNPGSLLHFSSATNTLKRKGEPFLKKFIDGPIKIRDLIASDRFAIYKVRSPELVVNIYSM